MEPVDVSLASRASFGTRFVAALIDGIGLAVINYILSAMGLQILGLFLNLGYFTYFEGSPAGQTFGKRIMNIRVVDAQNGGAIDYGRAAIRWLARILSALPIGLGYFWMLWDENKQTWHDKLSTTVVVSVPAS